MHLKSCIYFDSKVELIKFISNKKNDFIKYSNKFRSSIALGSENDLNLVHTNASLITHEILTQFLTYEYDAIDKKWLHPTEPLISQQSRQLWIQDIDVWVFLPPKIAEKVKSFGSHIFIYDNIDFIHDLQ